MIVSTFLYFWWFKQEQACVHLHSTLQSSFPLRQLLLPAQCLSSHYISSSLPIGPKSTTKCFYTDKAVSWALSDNQSCCQVNQIPRWPFEPTRPYSLPIQTSARFLVDVYELSFVCWCTGIEWAILLLRRTPVHSSSTLLYQPTMFIACVSQNVQSAENVIRIAFRCPFDR